MALRTVQMHRPRYSILRDGKADRAVTPQNRRRYGSKGPSPRQFEANSAAYIRGDLDLPPPPTWLAILPSGVVAASAKPVAVLAISKYSYCLTHDARR